MRSRALDDTYYSSDSSDSCQDSSDKFSLASYRRAKLREALERRLDFARAVAELTGVLQVSEYSALPHALQAALLADIDAAVEACSRCSPRASLTRPSLCSAETGMLDRDHICQIFSCLKQ